MIDLALFNQQNLDPSIKFKTFANSLASIKSISIFDIYTDSRYVLSSIYGTMVADSGQYRICSSWSSPKPVFFIKSRTRFQTDLSSIIIALYLRSIVQKEGRRKRYSTGK